MVWGGDLGGFGRVAPGGGGGCGGILFGVGGGGLIGTQGAGLLRGRSLMDETMTWEQYTGLRVDGIEIRGILNPERLEQNRWN